MEGGFAGWVTGVIFSFGYGGVAFLMVAESLFPPIPLEVMLPLAGFLVWQGDLGFISVLSVSTLGSLLGPPQQAAARDGSRAGSRRRLVRHVRWGGSARGSDCAVCP